MSRSSVGALARIARRNIARSRGRSALIVLLILLPVAAMAAGITLISTVTPTGEETATNRMGRADYEVQSGGSLTTAALQRLLPATATIEPWAYDLIQLALPGRTVEVSAQSMDLDGLAHGKLEIIEGRPPSNDHEVAVSRSLAEFAGTGLGGQIDLAERGTVGVVGIVENSFNLKGRLVLLDSSFARRQANGEELGASPVWLVSVPPGDMADNPCVDQGASFGQQPCEFAAYSRAFASQPSADASLAILVLGGLALVEAILVAAAAFAVSVRRRQRELGLLAATGAERRHLAGTVLIEAAVLGGIAAIGGVALGIGIVLAASPWLDQLVNRRVLPVELNSLYLLLAGGVGFVACLMAAGLPARAAARLPVLAALSGRRPPQGSARRLLLGGAALVVLGLVMTSLGAALRLRESDNSLSVVLLLLGAIVGVLGFGASSPWLIERLERLGLGLPPAARIALRDTARARSRNAPIVTAMLAAFAATVAVSSYFASNDALAAAHWKPWLRSDQLVVRGPGAGRAGPAAAAALGAVAAAPLRPIQSDGSERYIVVEAPEAGVAEVQNQWDVTIGEADLLHALDADAVAPILAEGGVVLFRPPGSQPLTSAAVSVYDAATGTPVTSLTLPVAVITTSGYEDGLVSAVVSASVARQLGMSAGDVDRYVIRLPRKTTEADVARAAVFAADEPNTTADAALGPPQPAQLFRMVLMALSLLFALSVTGIAVALGEAEARPDQRTLLAIGADPGIRRRIAASRAGVLAIMAGVLAVPAGLLPAWGLLGSRGAPLVVPWPEVVTAAAILPLAGIVGALVLTRRIPAWSALRQAGS